MNNLKKELKRGISIKEGVLLFYELSVFLFPLFVLFALLHNIVSYASVILIFLYILPWLIHGGMFGDKLKRKIDKLLGY